MREQLTTEDIKAVLKYLYNYGLRYVATDDNGVPHAYYNEPEYYSEGNFKGKWLDPQGGIPAGILLYDRLGTTADDIKPLEIAEALYPVDWEKVPLGTPIFAKLPNSEAWTPWFYGGFEKDSLTGAIKNYLVTRWSPWNSVGGESHYAVKECRLATANELVKKGFDPYDYLHKD